VVPVDDEEGSVHGFMLVQQLSFTTSERMRIKSGVRRILLVPQLRPDNLSV